VARSICKKKNCDRPVARFGLCGKHDYAKNKNYHNTRSKANYPKYKKKAIARANERYKENREDILKVQKEKRAANPKAARKKDNAYYQANKVHLATEERKRYWKNREKKCNAGAVYYQKNKKKIKKRVKKYRKNNPEMVRKFAFTRYKLESETFGITADAYRYAIMAWKGVIMKRDGRKCVYCGKKGKKAKLEAHHIIYKKTNKAMALIENNGIILCHKCHKELHRLNPIKYGRRK
jgi:5-methylcytosine-specific restriction endonuclease McrA